MPDNALIQTSQVSGVTVVEVTTRCRLIDDAIIEPLSADLLKTVDAANPRWIVLDLSQTQFFGSAFIEALLRVWREMQTQPDSRLVLCGVQEYCREVLTITHLDQLWPVVSTRAAALLQFSKPA